MKNVIIKIFILITIIWVPKLVSAQDHVERISYAVLKKAYDDYDQDFFKSRKGKAVYIVNKKDKVINAVLSGPGLCLLVDWCLNTNAAIEEHDFYENGDTTIISIYHTVKNITTQYVILKNGLKPRIYFKRGKNNWYKIRKTEDCILLNETEKPIEYMNK